MKERFIRILKDLDPSLEYHELGESSVEVLMA